MASRVQKFLDEAMTSLTDEERLLVSLELRESVPRESSDTVDAAWAEEIERRLDLLDRGQAVVHDGDQVVRRIREKLRSA
jgi:DUF1009 family protein